MKTAICILILLGIIIGLFHLLRPTLDKKFRHKAGIAIGEEQPPSNEPIKAPSEPVERQTTFEDLLDAIEWVESRGDAGAVGDNGEAVGSFQIHKIYVDDVNRIIWLNLMRIPTFKYEDRRSKEKSRLMTTIYLEYWGGPYIDYLKLEKLARIHAGGPAGWKKDCTKPYWEKVRKQLEKSCP